MAELTKEQTKLVNLIENILGTVEEDKAHLLRGAFSSLLMTLNQEYNQDDSKS